jgi:hypothetical protein
LNACGGASRSVNPTGCVLAQAASYPRQERLWIQTFNFVEMSWFRHMDGSKLITRAVVAAVGMDPMTY